MFVPLFFEGFKEEIHPGQTLIDFGCGKAVIAKEFLAKGLNTTLVDISPYLLDEKIRNLLPLNSSQIRFVQGCLWQPPKTLDPAHWIYCSNALERVPEEKIDAAFEEIAKRMQIGGYFSIALASREKKGWWEEKITSYFQICGEDVVADERYFNCRVRSKSNNNQ